ncbi:MAG TPA: C25 family cysteine peptidase [Solirubrobacterales bacterium]|nr:C25 family cysteine peptidase [Solirubrobacterales bacterium]
MPRSVSRTLVVAMAMGLFALTIWGATAGQAAKKKGSSPASSLKVLVAKTNKLPDDALPAAKLKGLERAATHARLVAGKSPCGAVKDLNRYRRILLGVKVKKGKKGRKAAAKLAALGPASLKASSTLLASKATKRCGGGTKPSRLGATKTKILSSDLNGMKLEVQLPAVQFVAKADGGQTWSQLMLPDTEAPGKPGEPGIPVASSVIGVPDGAQVVVKASDVDSYTLDGVNVYPAQPDAADAIAKAPDFDKPPFVNKGFSFDGKAYNEKGLVPAAAADGVVLGQSRDLTIGNLTVPAAQYNPKTDSLKVLTSVDVTVTFKGGTHSFSNQLLSPWEQAQRRLASSLLNTDIIKVKNPPIWEPCGEEMLVITNPATLTAANTFAVARRAAGIRTTVVQTGAAPGQIGTTATAIQAFIRTRVAAIHCIRPSYVTIMGDDELVPTFTTGPGGIPSDNPYSTANDTDELPDIAIGRILGNDLAQVETAVGKILKYETAAPGGAAFLNHATLAAQFQDTESAEEVNDGQEIRTFSRFAEQVRSGLVKRGVTVDRIYADSPVTNPLKFNDGTPVPASLQKPTFPWDGDGADVSSAWNAGRFLIIHRDHGWSDGWGDPFFTTTEVEALKNGALLPVVMSINCASAQYDTDETSFVQQALVKADGGAVGVFGDTRNSPSWHNSELGLGFVDALLPSVLPAEGPEAKQRVGDALIHGKLRLAGLAPPSGPGISGGSGSTRNELYLWHYFGDPTMQMWGGGVPPLVYTASQLVAVFRAKVTPPGPGPEPFGTLVTLPKELAGQPISLLQNGQVIGKAIAGDGSVTIPATFANDAAQPGELEVAVEGDGAQQIKVPVTGVPKAATTLKQACPQHTNPGAALTVTGTLSGAPTGSALSVTFKNPAGASTVVNATTDANGAWKASVTPSANEQGNWTVSSSYAGTDKYEGSKSDACTVLVEFIIF